MRTVVVVVLPPGLDPDPSARHGQEPGGVQTFAAQAGVEGFDEAVVRRLSRFREVQLDLVQISPLIEHPTSELRTVVHPNARRLATMGDQPVKFLGDLIRPEVRPRTGRENLSRMAVEGRLSPLVEKSRPKILTPSGPVFQVSATGSEL